jgi:ketosteroid isomerase-like protein
MPPDPHHPSQGELKMKNQSKIGLAILLLAAVGSLSIGMMQSDESEKQAVARANEQFYAALNKVFAGDTKPMQDVWSHADDVTYMGPDGGFQVGWSGVLGNWNKHAAMKLGGSVKPESMHTTIGSTLAVIQGFEKGENANVKGKPQKVAIRTTNLYRKENGQWKMIGHHTDKLSYLD